MALSVLFTDLNAYFASVEQQLERKWRGRPLAVVPVMADTTCCIAVSYEAKRFGIKTGTIVSEARRLCPDLILVPGRFGRYVEFHHRVKAAIETCLPVHMVHSIDEFSCRLMGRECARVEAIELARRIKIAVREQVGECVRCSIGIAPNRFLAKVASDMEKPDGLVTLEDHDLPGRLFSLELIDLPGIGPRMRSRLNRLGIQTVEQLWNLSPQEMSTAWGSVVGAVFYRWLRGEDAPEAPTPRRTIGHQHVLPPAQRRDADARAVLIRLLHKAAARTRYEGYWARRLTVSLRYLDRESWRESASFPECRDTLTLLQAMIAVWDRRPHGRILRVGITLEDLKHDCFATPPIFTEAAERDQLSSTMDRINAAFGRHAVYFAAMHEARHSAPTRIAFDYIPDLTMPEIEDEFAKSRQNDPAAPR